VISPGRAPPPDGGAAPSLPAGASLVALVPATGDLDAAAAAAWEYARRLATSGRRVALIDCFVDAPRLHAVTGESNEDGIVDVFEYGASLSRIARAQPEGSLFFVPAGTFAPDPASVMARPRWRRLSAGFRHEDAVMLLFLPPDCLGVLASDVDGLVALAPGRPDVDPEALPEIRAAVGRGTPLIETYAAIPATRAPAPEAAGHLAPGAAAPSIPAEAVPATAATETVATGTAAVEAGPAEQAPPAPAAPVRRITLPDEEWQDYEVVRETPVHLRRPPTSRRPRRRVAPFALVVVLAAAAAVVHFRRTLGWTDDLFAPAPPVAAARVPAGFRALAPHAVDTLPFAVQVSAWTSFPQALEDADTIAGRGFAPIVSPVRLPRGVWFRVYAGPVATEDAADSLLAAIRAAGLDGSGTAAVALVPLSFALRRVATLARALGERTRLRSAGIPAFVLGQADGSFRLFAGAFEAPDRAGYLDSLLTSIGSAGPLGPRVGFTP